MQPTEMLIYGGGGAFGLGLLGWLIKYLVITAFATRSEAASINLGDTMMERLHNEIGRLEEIIRKQDERIRVLEQKLEAVRQTDNENFADVADMSAIIEASCMRADICPSNAKLQMIIERIRSRRMP